MKQPIVAIMYDFDKTLCTKDMQGYGFIPSLGITEEEFWNYANEIGHKEHMDSILAYMYAMVKISKDKNIPLLREKLVETGKKVELFDGVSKWFSRINNFGKKLGVCVEHYVISSGLKEIIEGTDIANEFKSIFACEFLYDENGNGIWPKTDVNYTNKTQFVYRINKGVLDVANDNDLNKSMPDDSKRIPFCNMIYIGDGLTDVPSMKLTKLNGGHSIAVWQENEWVSNEMLLEGRVDFAVKADYSKGSEMEKTVFAVIDQIAASAKTAQMHVDACDRAKRTREEA